MWNKLLNLFQRNNEEFLLSAEKEFMSVHNDALAEMHERWKEPWVLVTNEAKHLLNLSIENIKALPESAKLELPAHMEQFSGEIEHGVMLNGEHTIYVVISSNELIDGKMQCVHPLK